MKRLCVLAFLGAMAVSGAAHAAGAPGPRPEAGLGLPRDVSVEGHRIDSLLFSTAILTTILFVIMVVWLVWALVVHRDGKHKAEYEPGDGKKNVTTAVMLSSVIFLIVDGNLFINAMIDVSEVFWNFPTSEEAVRIEVNARQWSWGARYAGTDGEWNTADDIVTLNDVRVPVDTPVVLQLASVDVIHSFYLPNLRVKTDAVPGSVNHLWFEAKETGVYDIACAQHCGVHHYKMGGLLTVYSREDYDAWHDRASADAVRAFDPADEDAKWGWDWEREEGD